MDTAWGKKRHYLKLKEKIEVIKASEKDRGLKHDDLARKFKCGRTQISRILKNKKSILSLYGSNRSATVQQALRVKWRVFGVFVCFDLYFVNYRSWQAEILQECAEGCIQGDLQKKIRQT